MEVQLTKDNFEAEVLKSDLPVVVDFWAEWCNPCKILGPLISELATQYQGKLKVGKVNVDQESDLSMKYNILSIPTIKFFKNGLEVSELIGAVPKATLEAEIQKLFKLAA